LKLEVMVKFKFKQKELKLYKSDIWVYHLEKQSSCSIEEGLRASRIQDNLKAIVPPDRTMGSINLKGHPQKCKRGQ